MKLNRNFFGGGGGGTKQKNLPLGEYGYFLELHNQPWSCFKPKPKRTVSLFRTLQAPLSPKPIKPNCLMEFDWVYYAIN